MDNRQQLRTAIQNTIRAMMNRVMENVLVRSPFDVEAHRANKPLYAALVPDEIFHAAHFERRFVTPFGKAWERLAEAVATANLGYSTREHTITGNVGAERLRRIQGVLDRLEHPQEGEDRVRPDWDTELAHILEGGGEPRETIVNCDLYAEDRRNGRRYAFELKAPLPNSDQTKVSKEKLLKLYSMDPPQIDEAYYALPYNPYGERQDYAWTFPARWFDMHRDDAVLIGPEFWEILGGPGTYEALIDAVDEIGTEYKNRIYREFLGVDPPLQRK